MFTHVEKFRLKQVLEVVTKALSQNNLLNPEFENDLVICHRSLKNLIKSVTVKQDGMKKTQAGKHLKGLNDV